MLNPLLLITQLHRSGGTLFSQLLDGHSAIQAHPHELFIGKPEKWDWPMLADKLADPAAVFTSLQEEKIAAIGAGGLFIKPGSNKAAKGQEVPFTYSVDRHREIFTSLYQQALAKSQRFAIQLYLDTFFLAWPEYKASGRERFVSCFLPHIVMHDGSMLRLFTDFPDLLLVNLIRRPDTWLASLVNHISLDLSDQIQVIKNLERWRASVKRILILHENPSVRSFATSYEALVSDPRSELERFCAFSGLTFEPIMLLPTVGGFPVLPNSSYRHSSSGINKESLALRQPLSEAVAQIINDRYLPVYAKAQKRLDASRVA